MKLIADRRNGHFFKAFIHHAHSAGGEATLKLTTMDGRYSSYAGANARPIIKTSDGEYKEAANIVNVTDGGAGTDFQERKQALQAQIDEQRRTSTQVKKYLLLCAVLYLFVEQKEW